MSAEPKISRQGKASDKTAYLVRLQNCNYDWLCSVARQKRVSVAKLLNAILRSKPEPDEFYIR